MAQIQGQMQTQGQVQGQTQGQTQMLTLKQSQAQMQAQTQTQRQKSQVLSDAMALSHTDAHVRGVLSVKQLWAHLYDLTLNGTLTLPQFCAQARPVCRHAPASNSGPKFSSGSARGPTSSRASASANAPTSSSARASAPLSTSPGPVREDDPVDYEALTSDAITLGRTFHRLLQSRQTEDGLLLPPLLGELKQFFRALMDEK
jgi:hypothetical protein